MVKEVQEPGITARSQQSYGDVYSLLVRRENRGSEARQRH